MRMNAYVSAIGLLLLSALCGCNFITNPNCNVTLGSVRGVLIHDSAKCMEPALVRLPDGNLLASYPCNFQTMNTQLSSDGGATWSSRSTIPLVASAEALSLLPNGRLFLSSSDQMGVPFFMTGMIGSGDRISWSAPVFVKTPKWKNGCWAVSPVVELANHNLLWPVWCGSDTATNIPGSSTVLISTDSGETWPTQVTVANAATENKDYDESAAVVYPNGDVILIIRQTTNEPRGRFLRSKSTDNGYTWSPPVPVASNGVAGRPTLALLASGGLVLVARAQVAGHSTTGYETSWDEGLTFSAVYDLEIDGPRSRFDEYDAMSLLPDGSIGVVTAHDALAGSDNISISAI